MNCIEFHELCWVACTAQCELQWYHSYNLEWLLLLHWFKQRFFTHIGPATYIFANIKLSQGPRLPCSVLLYLLLKLPQHHQSNACVHLHGHRSSWVSQFQVIKPWFQFTHHWSSSTAFVAKAMMNKQEGQLGGGLLGCWQSLQIWGNHWSWVTFLEASPALPQSEKVTDSQGHF